MENKLIIDPCNCEDGYTFGCRLHDHLKEKGIEKFCISVVLYQKEVFRYMSDACIVDNAHWLERKKNACLYFGMATKDLFLKNQGQEKNLIEKYGLSYSDYTWTPGSIPIVLKNQQVIGAVTVSGMKPEEDHQCILDVYRQNRK